MILYKIDCRHKFQKCRQNAYPYIKKIKRYFLIKIEF